MVMLSIMNAPKTQKELKATSQYHHKRIKREYRSFLKLKKN